MKNELALSPDINIITAEINAYQRMAGEAIFEIGRRLKHVKENDLVHGEWTQFCGKINMDARQANKFIKVVNDLGVEWSMSTTLGFEALYQIATMPEDQRTESHTVPSTGESKTVDEMTVKELREIKKKLKEEEEYRKLMEDENEQLQRKLNQTQTVPKTVEKIIEVEKVIDNTDYSLLDKMKESVGRLQRDIQRKDDAIERANNQIELYEKRLQQEEHDANTMREMKREMDMLKSEKGDMFREVDAAKELGRFQAKVQVFLLEEMSPLAYSKLKNELEESETLNRSFTETLDLIDEWISNMRNQIRSRKAYNDNNNIIIDAEVME